MAALKARTPRSPTHRICSSLTKEERKAFAGYIDLLEQIVEQTKQNIFGFFLNVRPMARVSYFVVQSEIETLKLKFNRMPVQKKMKILRATQLCICFGVCDAISVALNQPEPIRWNT